MGVAQFGSGRHLVQADLHAALAARRKRAACGRVQQVNGLILNLLAEKRTATVQVLCEALNASESTIRRDLTELARQGRLNKVHGGATLPDGQFLADEPTMAAKEALAVGQKRSIAQAAADLIRAEDFIYIDAGTTTLAMIRALSGPALEAHYVTNGIAHARLLAQKSCHVCVPGGLLRPRTEAIIGAAAITALQQFNFTKAFIGANGVALNVGFTTPDPEEAAVKAVAVRRARTQWPSHWFSWLQTSEQTVVRGLFSNSIRPASSSLLAFKRRMTSGILVWIGQPCWQRGTLQPRQWFASSITCSAMFYSFISYRFCALKMQQCCITRMFSPYYAYITTGLAVNASPIG